MTTNALNAYILLDRTGSMSSRWSEALSSINSYVKELAKGKAKATITVAVFDAQNGLQFDVIRKNQPAKSWKDLTNEDATPRGMTPLLDAVGRIVALAEDAGKKKTVLVVMTDGFENASREVSREQAKAALDRCRDKKWQVVFLGADFDAFGQAVALGTQTGQTLNMARGTYKTSMDSLAGQTIAYASSESSISFSDEDRKKASK